MIKKPRNWENVKAATDRVQLPAGGYIVKIIGAKQVSYPTQNGSIDRLEIGLDIAEGEYKDFYKADFDSGKRQNEDYKWKGVLRLYIPLDDGSEKDEWTQSAFKGMTQAIEESNSGYRWDWDETKLKGKTVGCLFRLEEWAMNGKKGWKAQPFKFIPIENVRSGKFNEPKFKAHRDYPGDTPDNYQQTAGNVSGLNVSFDPIDEDDGDLPFDC